MCAGLSVLGRIAELSLLDLLWKFGVHDLWSALASSIAVFTAIPHSH